MDLEEALNSGNALVNRPISVAKVAKRIAKVLGGEVSLEEVCKVASVLDLAAWEADGAGVSGVLIGFMVGLEVATGVKAPISKVCDGCDKMVKPGDDYCTLTCRRRAKERAKWAARAARSEPLAA